MRVNFEKETKQMLCWFLEDNLDTMCACVAKYNFCEQECSVYTENIASDDSACFDAFVDVVCVSKFLFFFVFVFNSLLFCSDGVDGSFFGTPYNQICPEQCPSNNYIFGKICFSLLKNNRLSQCSLMFVM